MLTNTEDKIIQETLDNSPLTRELLEKEGFEIRGRYSNYEIYNYRKSCLGVVELHVYNIWTLLDNNTHNFSDDSVVAVVDTVHPFSGTHGVQQHSTRYLFTLGDLKNFFKYRKLKTKITQLQHQIADMLDSNLLLDGHEYVKLLGQ